MRTLGIEANVVVYAQAGSDLVLMRRVGEPSETANHRVLAHAMNADAAFVIATACSVLGEAMAELARAGAQFRKYQEGHEAKGALDKARTNQHFAERIEALLLRAQQGGPGAKPGAMKVSVTLTPEEIDALASIVGFAALPALLGGKDHLAERLHQAAATQPSSPNAQFVARLMAESIRAQAGDPEVQP